MGGLLLFFAIMIRKEILTPDPCGIFLAENLSVVLQVAWFKYTRRQVRRRAPDISMSPLHHHYQKLGYHESKSGAALR